MAEGEFAQVKDHLETITKEPGWIRDILGREEKDRYTMLADLAVLQRDEAALRQYAPLAEELALRDNNKLYQAIAHRTWGVYRRLTGEYEKSEIRLNQALDLFQDLGTRWQIGRTEFELAELAMFQADMSKAHDYFSRALVSFEEMHAVPDAERTREALASLNR